MSICFTLQFHFVRFLCLHWGGREVESEDKGTGYFHLNTGNVFVLNFAAGLAFGGHRLMGNTCL